MKNKIKWLFIILLLTSIIGVSVRLFQKEPNIQKEEKLYGSYRTTIHFDGIYMNSVFGVNHNFAIYEDYFIGYSGKYYLIDGQRYLLEFYNGDNIEIELFEDSFYFPIESNDGTIRMIRFDNIGKLPSIITTTEKQKLNHIIN